MVLGNKGEEWLAHCVKRVVILECITLLYK